MQAFDYLLLYWAVGAFINSIAWTVAKAQGMITPAYAVTITISTFTFWLPFVLASMYVAHKQGGKRG
jgi:hypothetical protein